MGQGGSEATGLGDPYADGAESVVGEGGEKYEQEAGVPPSMFACQSDGHANRGEEHRGEGKGPPSMYFELVGEGLFLVEFNQGIPALGSRDYGMQFWDRHLLRADRPKIHAQ